MQSIGKLWGWWGWGNIPRWPYVLQIWNGGSLSPWDWTTYYFGSGQQSSTADSTDYRLYVPQKWIIKKCYIEIRNAWTAWTTETSTMSILKTDASGTTATTVSSAIVTNDTINSFSNTSLSLVVNEWDYICMRWVAPTRVTNPTTLSFNFMFVIEPQPCITSWGKIVLQWWWTWLAPASGVTLYLNDGVNSTTDTTRIRVPYTWVITYWLVNIRNSTNWTPTAGEAWFNLWVNSATAESVWTSALWWTSVTLSNTLTTAVTAWDFLCLQMTNPTWTTAPTWVVVDFSFVLTIT